jgi:uncharacterized protein (DUF433 family)
MDTSIEHKDFELPPLEVEMYGGEPYEYHPLGKYIVMAPGVCGGRPTFKYTRLEASMILACLSTGRTIEKVVKDYRGSHLTQEAVEEAIRLGSFVRQFSPNSAG